MSVLDDPNEFKNNPLFEKREFGDFSSFYVTITICTIFGAFLFILNIYLCCCSKYREYWQDSNTGNRWLLPIWTKTPYQQPPLDFSELEKSYVASQEVYAAEVPQGYLELQKRESDL